MNDLINWFEVEENKVMIVDSYNLFESDIEFDLINGYENIFVKFVEIILKDYENVLYIFKLIDLLEDYLVND